MRSEVEIRREVESRIKRRGLLLLHAALWAAISFGLFVYSRVQDVPSSWAVSAAMVMAIWLLGVGLHGFWVIYVEVRERAVQSAIERERQSYGKPDSYEKRKHEQAHPLGTDGELSEDQTDWEREDAERSRNSSRS